LLSNLSLGLRSNSMRWISEMVFFTLIEHYPKLAAKNRTPRPHVAVITHRCSNWRGVIFAAATGVGVK
jgi:hypothetical protein